MGKLREAKSLCSDSSVPIARLLEKGISRIGKSTDEITKAIEGAGALEIYRLEKNVSLIGTFAGVAPMIGFLGTVIGMIIAFHEMASQGGQAEINLLATGIYTAMTTTVAGLIVGIICSLSYNHLVITTENLLHTMEVSIISFMDTLNNPED
ncbi:biopolymer transport protein ExbB [Elysia marginata]|uniref:Biopolymer transport protein ExbB n=1 Tax=Elysia marginata TaxID=1093978 RepID=A0AAV4FQ14_9GAST|nr:biopolymer transport protein ExbB [Elysia marginata]